METFILDAVVRWQCNHAWIVSVLITFILTIWISMILFRSDTDAHIQPSFNGTACSHTWVWNSFTSSPVCSLFSSDSAPVCLIWPWRSWLQCYAMTALYPFCWGQRSQLWITTPVILLSVNSTNWHHSISWINSQTQLFPSLCAKPLLSKSLKMCNVHAPCKVLMMTQLRWKGHPIW